MIEKFFDTYAQAFMSFDLAAISSAYEFPMTFYTEEGDAVSMDASAQRQ